MKEAKGNVIEIFEFKCNATATQFKVFARENDIISILLLGNGKRKHKEVIAWSN